MLTVSVQSAVTLAPRFTPCQGEGNKLESGGGVAGGGASTMHIAHVEDRLHLHTTAHV